MLTEDSEEGCSPLLVLNRGRRLEETAAVNNLLTEMIVTTTASINELFVVVIVARLPLLIEH